MSTSSAHAPEASGSKAGTGGNGFEPRIVAFVCKWCTYAGADLAGTSRMEYPSNVRVLMLPCTGRIGITMPLRAFLQGADAVLVSGCHPGDCHYSEGNFRARRRWIMMRHLLETVGFDLRRFELAWISAAEGAKFVKVIADLTERIRELGPYQEVQELRSHEVSVAPGLVPPAFPPAAPAGAPAVIPELGAAVGEALAAERIRGVAGWIAAGRLHRSRLAWISTPEEAARLVAPQTGRGNVIRLLARRPWRFQAPIGVVARPVEMMSLNVLLQEGQFAPSDVRVFGIEEDGRFIGEMDAEQAATLVRERAKALPANRPAGFSPEILESLDRMAEWPAEKRWEFWTKQFERCVKCYACRQSCPTCYCPSCIVEKNQPQWIPTAADGAGNLAWHVVRAFHMEGRCVGCRACETACPEGIPLTLLYAAAAKSNLEEFAFRPGIDAAAKPLQSDFKPGDSEDFIQ